MSWYFSPRWKLAKHFFPHFAETTTFLACKTGGKQPIIVHEKRCFSCTFKKIFYKEIYYFPESNVHWRIWRFRSAGKAICIRTCNVNTCIRSDVSRAYEVWAKWLFLVRRARKLLRMHRSTLPFLNANFFFTFFLYSSYLCTYFF